MVLYNPGLFRDQRPRKRKIVAAPPPVMHVQESEPELEAAAAFGDDWQLVPADREREPVSYDTDAVDQGIANLMMPVFVVESFMRADRLIV